MKSKPKKSFWESDGWPKSEAIKAWAKEKGIPVVDVPFPPEQKVMRGLPKVGKVPASIKAWAKSYNPDRKPKVGHYVPMVVKKGETELGNCKDGTVFWMVCLGEGAYFDVMKQSEAEILSRLVRIENLLKRRRVK